MPIIGVNECGKTTILHALLAFDHYNDRSNHSGQHLRDIENLYSTSPVEPRVSAEIELTLGNLQHIIKTAARSFFGRVSVPERYLDSLSSYQDSVVLQRNLNTKKYTIESLSVNRNQEFEDKIARAIVKQLPYILYFDDFQDSVPERIEIPIDESKGGDWLAIIETLFKRTDEDFSVFDLREKEVRQRKSILSKVKRTLNETLTQQWKNFRLDDSDALEISIDYDEPSSDDEQGYLKFDIVEKDASGDEHFFFVRNRSKGFYWFFNFVMKLEFNPKVVEGAGVDAIYVLDEPGSYLHAVAQERLCSKLKQLSQDNVVIYCTHSHHLLNPEVIPLNTIRVAEKDRDGKVTMVPIYQHKGLVEKNRAAYQPVLDALQVRPLMLDLYKDNVVIVEGMVDSYVLEMFRESSGFRMLPSVGADSMKFYISIMIAWGVPHKALWDNDRAGRAGLKDATSHFGQDHADRRFFLLPLASAKSKKRIMQDLVDGKDVSQMKTSLGLPKNTKFDKVISSLFYSPSKTEILDGLTGTTRDSIKELVSTLTFD